MFLIIVVVCVIMLVEKCAKGGFEFYSVRGVAVIFECVPVFLLFRRTVTLQMAYDTHSERSWTLCLPVENSFLLPVTVLVKVESMMRYRSLLKGHYSNGK